MKHFHACCPSHATTHIANRLFGKASENLQPAFCSLWALADFSLEDSLFGFHSSCIVTYAQVQR